MMSKRAWATKAILATALLVGMGIGTGAYAAFYDTFDAGNLNNWVVVGNGAAVAPGEGGSPYAAKLDDGNNDATMFASFQTFGGSNLSHHYQFDFNVTGLSSFVPDGGFPDYFSATLYFSDTAPVLSMNGVDGLSLMDANYTLVKYSGATGVPGQNYENGTVSALEPDWYRYAVDYLVPLNPLTGLEYLYAIPVFDLRSTNGVGGDSSVLIDNVTPEPLTMVMLGCLGAGMVAARKLRRK